MADKQVRVGVIGVGGMGQGHCTAIRDKVPAMKLMAVCDAQADRVKEVAEKFGVQGFTDVNAMLDSGLVDAVVIATPHPIHEQPALAAMKKGIHVICEKPLTERISTAQKMVETAKKCKVAFAVMFQRRFEPAVAKALEIIRSGRVGRIYRATMISPEYRSQAYYNSGTWRATWKGEGGGVMMNQSPHIMDIFVHLTGMPVCVRGRIETSPIHTIEVEDRAEATLEYADGGTGYFYCSTTEPGPGQMIEIFGDKGKLLFRNGTLQFFEYEQPISVFTRENKEMWGSVKQTEVDLKLEQFDTGHFLAHRNFADHILNGTPLHVSGESALPSLELANAITLSSLMGEPVKLPLKRAAYDALLNDLQTNPKYRKGIRPGMAASSGKKSASAKKPAKESVQKSAPKPAKKATAKKPAPKASTGRK